MLLVINVKKWKWTKKKKLPKTYSHIEEVTKNIINYETFVARLRVFSYKKKKMQCQTEHKDSDLLSERKNEKFFIPKMRKNEFIGIGKNIANNTCDSRTRLIQIYHPPTIYPLSRLEWKRKN